MTQMQIELLLLCVSLVVLIFLSYKTITVHKGAMICSASENASLDKETKPKTITLSTCAHFSFYLHTSFPRATVLIMGLHTV